MGWEGKVLYCYARVFDGSMRGQRGERKGEERKRRGGETAKETTEERKGR